MKKLTIALALPALLIVLIVMTGCVQNSGSSPGQDNLLATPSSPPIVTGSPTSSISGQPSPGAASVQKMVNGSPGTNGQVVGSGPGTIRSTGNGQAFLSFLSNKTLLTEAAGKLGVSEQDLENALNANAISNGPVNFNAAATQLGVTTQQLVEALGLAGPVTMSAPGNGNGPVMSATPGNNGQ